MMPTWILSVPVDGAYVHPSNMRIQDPDGDVYTVQIDRQDSFSTFLSFDPRLSMEPILVRPAIKSGVRRGLYKKAVWDRCILTMLQNMLLARHLVLHPSGFPLLAFAEKINQCTGKNPRFLDPLFDQHHPLLSKAARFRWAALPLIVHLQSERSAHQQMVIEKVLTNTTIADLIDVWAAQAPLVVQHLVPVSLETALK